MNYIYDILLNFQENYYNFFEWKREDKIKNIKKISLYRVSDQDVKILKNNQVQVCQDFIERIKIDNKKHHSPICLVSNGKIALGLMFDADGNLIKRSSLLFEEEDEVLDSIKDLKELKITYLKNEERLPSNKLRIEKEKKSAIIDYIKNTSDMITIKYLYYEYFEEEQEDLSAMKKELIKELSKEWNKKQNNLYNLINILSKVK